MYTRLLFVKLNNPSAFSDHQALSSKHAVLIIQFNLFKNVFYLFEFKYSTDLKLGFHFLLVAGAIRVTNNHMENVTWQLLI